METIKLSYPHPYEKEALPEAVGAIGFFDGVHKGHQEVIKSAVQEAKKRKMESAVISFYPHPSVVLNKDTSVNDVKYITPLKEKKAMLRHLQVDRLYLITFNKTLSTLSPQEFIDHFIVGLHIKHLVAGFDFSFGYKGKGNMNNIEQFSNGRFTFKAINKVEENNEKISSTNIRKFLKRGAIEETTALLGRQLTATGVVTEGDKRGRTIGFPTANLHINEEALLPKPGVYAVKVWVQNEENKRYVGMANLGTRPTFTDETEPVLEVHILDFSGDLYGKVLTVEWHAFIRDEKKFNGINEIIQQLHTDEAKIRALFTEC